MSYASLENELDRQFEVCVTTSFIRNDRLHRVSISSAVHLLPKNYNLVATSVLFFFYSRGGLNVRANHRVTLQPPTSRSVKITRAQLHHPPQHTQPLSLNLLIDLSCAAVWNTSVQLSIYFPQLDAQKTLRFHQTRAVRGALHS